MRTMVIFVVSLAVSAPLAACTESTAQSGGAAKGSGACTIALLLPENSTPRYEGADKPYFEAKVARRAPVLIEHRLWNPFVAIAVTIALGAALGFAQGFIRTRFNVPSFVVTLGGLLLFYGLQLHVLGTTGTIRFPFGRTIAQIENLTFETSSSYTMAAAATPCCCTRSPPPSSAGPACSAGAVAPGPPCSAGLSSAPSTTACTCSTWNPMSNS
jgi:ribose/xylose/arabinose/galactoside ABC-type transport system permease subunit